MRLPCLIDTAGNCCVRHLVLSCIAAPLDSANARLVQIDVCPVHPFPLRSIDIARTGMQIVLPPAVARSSFQDTFSVFKEFNKVQWSAMPLETLYDTHKIIQDWDHMGFKVWKTPKLQELPSLVEPETAYPRHVLPSCTAHIIVQA